MAGQINSINDFKKLKIFETLEVLVRGMFSVFTLYCVLTCTYE